METIETVETLETVEVYDDMKEKEEDESLTELASPPKKKSKTQDDGVERPKKPRSAYLLYYFDVHQIMHQEIPYLPQSEINKRISESWKRLSVAERAFYLERAKAEKEGTEASSLNPPEDVPGFRKILPRATFVLLSKSCSPSELAEGVQPGLSLGTLSPVVEVEPTPACVPTEPQFIPLNLSSEVELAEESITADGLKEEEEEETAVTSHLQGILLSSASKGADSPELMEEVALMEGDEGQDKGQTEKTQMVAIVPSQKSMAVVSSVGPLMMVSVGGGVEMNAKTPYKRVVTTYTRRGWGRCPTPNCSYVYVTRHKPQTCPDCGCFLGGKKKPPVKKKRGKTKAAKQTEPQEETQADNNSQQDKNTEEDEQAKNKPAITAVAPLEGSSTQTQTQITPEKRTAAHDKSSAQKKTIRPILPAYHNTSQPMLHFITVPSDNGKLPHVVNINPVVGPAERLSGLSGLKPNTLKQLGHTLPAAGVKQDSLSGQQVVPVTDRGVNILSIVPFKQNTVSSFNLGLSTARGRGRCRNPSCDYVYKNRHKPPLCPKCRAELCQKSAKSSKSQSVAQLDPHQPLSPAQKDVQRQSTLQLLRRTLEIPETEAELQETLSLIEELNKLQIVWIQPAEWNPDAGGQTESETLLESGWPQFYESAATHCGLCGCQLFKGDQSTVAGQEDCWLLTETLIQTAAIQLKVCLNTQCLALHSFTDLHPGLFNIGNRLLVSIDLFLKIRANIKLGLPPAQAVRTMLDQFPNHPVHALSPDELPGLLELLLSGYWAFECLTSRDYNDMICGICGIVPKVEVARRDTHSVLGLTNMEFTWPEVTVSDEVHVDEFWLAMESEAIEQAAFPAAIHITRVDASIIAPFIPPLMRSQAVVNTEKDKVPSHAGLPSGDPATLVRLIHEGQLRLDGVEEHSEEELRTILERCGEGVTPGSTKDELLASLISLYTLVHTGVSTAPQPPPEHTAGKLSKVCPHKVVCGSKYMVRGETARDHVDLLVSSRHWPPVYVADCARQVALCTDVQYPELATQMWGRNQGCFSDPFEKPEFVSCAELQEQPYDPEPLSSRDNQQLHPLTKSASRWLVRPDDGRQSAEAAAVPDHHSMLLCRELEPLVGAVAALQQGETAEDGDKARTEETGSPPTDGETQSTQMVFDNAAYYYLYNRLMDFMSSRDIVNQQINEVVTACQPGQVVIRDALYRLGVAQIKAETDEEEDGEEEGGGGGEVRQVQDEEVEITDEVVPA